MYCDLLNVLYMYCDLLYGLYICIQGWKNIDFLKTFLFSPRHNNVKLALVSIYID